MTRSVSRFKRPLDRVSTLYMVAIVALHCSALLCFDKSLTHLDQALLVLVVLARL